MTKLGDRGRGDCPQPVAVARSGHPARLSARNVADCLGTAVFGNPGGVFTARIGWWMQVWEAFG